MNSIIDAEADSDPIIVGHDFCEATALRAHLLNEHSFKKIILIDPVAISPWGSPFFRRTGEQGKIAFYRQMAEADSKYTDEVQFLYPTITIATLILWGARIAGYRWSGGRTQWHDSGIGSSYD